MSPPVAAFAQSPAYDPYDPHAPGPYGRGAVSLGYAAPGRPLPGQFDHQAVEILRQTKVWVQLVSIIGLIVSGFVAVAAVVTFVDNPTAVRSSYSTGYARTPAGGRVGTTASTPSTAPRVPAVALLVNLLVAAVPATGSILLSRFGSRIGKLVRDRHPGDLERAPAAQKGFWIYSGILAIIFSALVLVGVAFVGLAHLII